MFRIFGQEKAYYVQEWRITMKLTKKQMGAWIAIFLIASLYVLTFFLSLWNHPKALTFFFASLCSTIALPLIIHLFLMMKNVKDGKSLWDNPYKKKN